MWMKSNLLIQFFPKEAYVFFLYHRRRESLSTTFESICGVVGWVGGEGGECIRNAIMYRDDFNDLCSTTSYLFYVRNCLKPIYFAMVEEIV